MNGASTNTQGSQILQNLQPQSSSTQQQTPSNFQSGSGVNLSNSDTAKLLNQGPQTGKLSVAVASANSQAAIPPPAESPLKNTGVSGVYVLVSVLLLVIAAVLVYRRVRRFNEQASGDKIAEQKLLEEAVTIAKTKKKRKKPKKPHHH